MAHVHGMVMYMAMNVHGHVHVHAMDIMMGMRHAGHDDSNSHAPAPSFLALHFRAFSHLSVVFRTSPVFAASLRSLHRFSCATSLTSLVFCITRRSRRRACFLSAVLVSVCVHCFYRCRLFLIVVSGARRSGARRSGARRSGARGRRTSR